MHVPVYASLSVVLCLDLSVFVSLCLPVCLCLSLSPCLAVCLSVSVPLSRTRVLAPVPLNIELTKFDRIQILLEIHIAVLSRIVGLAIITKFGTRHDSRTVVTCTKFRYDRPTIIEIRGTRIFSKFWIRSNLSIRYLVGQAPGAFQYHEWKSCDIRFLSSWENKTANDYYITKTELTFELAEFSWNAWLAVDLNDAKRFICWPHWIWVSGECLQQSPLCWRCWQWSGKTASCQNGPTLKRLKVKRPHFLGPQAQSPPIICHAPTASRREATVAIRGGGLANDWRRLWPQANHKIAAPFSR